MTTLEKLSRANRWRIRGESSLGTEDSCGWNGNFIVPIEGDLWLISISDCDGWRHLSITSAQRKVIPSWSVTCHAKNLFFGDDEVVVQYHPLKDNGDDHQYCLHLWESLEEPIPLPPDIFLRDKC